MFLHVVSLSDISTGDGRYLRSAAFTPQYNYSGRSSLEWPVQGRPPPSDWAFWKSALQDVFLLRGSLRQPLGTWLRVPDSWEWFFQPPSSLYHRSLQGVEEFSPRPGRPTRHATLSFHKDGQAVQCIPEHAHLATVDSYPTQLKLTGHATIHQNIGATPSATSFSDAAAALSPMERWAVSQFNITDSGSILAQAIRDGKCVAISDGSFKLGSGTAAFALEGSNKMGRLDGSCVVPGKTSDQSPYRSEIAGLYCIAVCVRIICTVFDIQSGKVTIGCDGQKALERCVYLRRTLAPDAKHFDLINATRRILESCPIEWQPQWVEGHQDDTPFIGPFDRLTTLNIEMDLAAKARWRQAFTGPSPLTPVDSPIACEPWVLTIAGTKQSGEVSKAISQHIGHLRGQAYWHPSVRGLEGRADPDADRGAARALRGRPGRRLRAADPDSRDRRRAGQAGRRVPRRAAQAADQGEQLDLPAAADALARELRQVPDLRRLLPDLHRVGPGRDLPADLPRRDPAQDHQPLHQAGRQHPSRSCAATTSS